MTVRFLREDSFKLLDKLLPNIEITSSHRIANYLSFYSSHTGQHLYHCPTLRSPSHLTPLFTDRPLPPPFNLPHIITKAFLGVYFQHHIIDHSSTFTMLNQLRVLHSAGKDDIASQFLRGKTLLHRGKIVPFEKELPSKQRKNVYVWYDGPIPQGDDLEKIVVGNGFYRLPHLNKILVYKKGTNRPLLPPALLKFCTENSIKIQLLEDCSLVSLLQNLYSNSKGKILIHECPNNDQSIYDLPTPLSKQRIERDQVANPLYTRIMPRQVVTLVQQLPKESLAKPGSESKILQVMRELIGLEDGQNLIDLGRRIDYSTLETNYRPDTHGEQSGDQSQGFVVQRLVTEQYLAMIQKPQFETPFTQQ